MLNDIDCQNAYFFNKETNPFFWYILLSNFYPTWFNLAKTHQILKSCTSMLANYFHMATLFTFYFFIFWKKQAGTEWLITTLPGWYRVISTEYHWPFVLFFYKKKMTVSLTICVGNFHNVFRINCNEKLKI